MSSKEAYISNTYWKHNGKYQLAFTALQNKLTYVAVDEGKATTKLRKAINCYLDLYYDGLQWRASEFNRVMGISSTQFIESKCATRKTYTLDLHRMTEVRMDEIVLRAAKEQNLPLISEQVIVKLLNEQTVNILTTEDYEEWLYENGSKFNEAVIALLGKKITESATTKERLHKLLVAWLLKIDMFKERT